MGLHTNKRRLLASDIPSPSVHKRQRVYVLHSEFLPLSSRPDLTSQWCKPSKEIIYPDSPSHTHPRPLQDSDSSSSDDLNYSHFLNGNPRSLTPAPAQVNELPWWLQPSSSAIDHDIDPKHVSNSQLCYYCTMRPAHHSTSCGRCDRMLCDICVRSCQSCQEIACPCCSIVDYSVPFERTLCFECFDEFSQHDNQNCANPTKSDGDHVMLAWD